jgi:hypothetical protein
MQVKAQIFYTQYASRTMALLACVCAIAVFAYGVFLLMAVAHAAKITDAQDREAALATQVSTLENQYLAGSEALTSDEAATMGYVTPSNVSMVYVASPAALTINTQ